MCNLISLLSQCKWDRVLYNYTQHILMCVCWIVYLRVLCFQMRCWNVSFWNSTLKRIFLVCVYAQFFVWTYIIWFERACVLHRGAAVIYYTEPVWLTASLCLCVCVCLSGTCGGASCEERGSGRSELETQTDNTSCWQTERHQDHQHSLGAGQPPPLWLQHLTAHQGFVNRHLSSLTGSKLYQSTKS